MTWVSVAATKEVAAVDADLVVDPVRLLRTCLHLPGNRPDGVV